jgi:hypothetical protein
MKEGRKEESIPSTIKAISENSSLSMSCFKSANDQVQMSAVTTPTVMTTIVATSATTAKMADSDDETKGDDKYELVR